MSPQPSVLPTPLFACSETQHTKCGARWQLLGDWLCCGPHDKIVKLSLRSCSTPQSLVRACTVVWLVRGLACRLIPYVCTVLICFSSFTCVVCCLWLVTATLLIVAAAATRTNSFVAAHGDASHNSLRGGPRGSLRASDGGGFGLGDSAPGGVAMGVAKAQGGVGVGTSVDIGQRGPTVTGAFHMKKPRPKAPATMRPPPPVRLCSLLCVLMCVPELQLFRSRILTMPWRRVVNTTSPQQHSRLQARRRLGLGTSTNAGVAAAAAQLVVGAAALGPPVVATGPRKKVRGVGFYVAALAVVSVNRCGNHLTYMHEGVPMNGRNAESAAVSPSSAPFCDMTESVRLGPSFVVAFALVFVLCRVLARVSK